MFVYITKQEHKKVIENMYEVYSHAWSNNAKKIDTVARIGHFHMDLGHNNVARTVDVKRFCLFFRFSAQLS